MKAYQSSDVVEYSLVLKDPESIQRTVSQLERYNLRFRVHEDFHRRTATIIMFAPKRGLARFLSRHGRLLKALGFPTFQD